MACVEAGIRAADPARAVDEAVSLEGEVLRIGDSEYDLGGYDEVVVVGGGKAAGAVAGALEGVLGSRIGGGVVVVPEPVALDRVEVVVGSHPIPDTGSVEGAGRVLGVLEAAGKRTLVVAVVTGGGSALLCAPAPRVGLDGLQAVTGELLAAGATIAEVNAVRKHVSRIKGGGLAGAAAPATVAGVLVSDVVGDDPGVIASGPTAPDASTFADAVAVVERYGISPPAGVKTRLAAGMRGEVPETPGPGDPVFSRVRNHLIASGMTAVAGARTAAVERGYGVCVLSTRIRGEAREVAKVHVAVAEESRTSGNPVSPPAVVLSGGETTVTVEGDGTGGPNLEFALTAGLELTDDDGEDGGEVVVACVDTDGLDGSTMAAGAIVDSGTVGDAATAVRALARNDAYPYLEDRGALIRTGPTGTNVNDLRVIVIEAPTGDEA